MERLVADALAGGNRGHSYFDVDNVCKLQGSSMDRKTNGQARAEVSNFTNKISCTVTGDTRMSDKESVIILLIDLPLVIYEY